MQGNVKALHKAANELAKKAEDLRQLTIHTQSNSLQKTVDIKEQVLADIDKQVKEKL